MSTPTAEFLDQMKSHMKTMGELAESFRKLTAAMAATMDGVEADDGTAAAAPAVTPAPASAATPTATSQPLNIWRQRYEAFLARQQAKKRAIYDRMISVCNVIPSQDAQITFDRHYMAMMQLGVTLGVEYAANKSNQLGCRIDRLREYETGCWRTIKPHGLVMIYKYSVWKITESPDGVQEVRHLGAINPETKEINAAAAPALPPAISDWNWF